MAAPLLRRYCSPQTQAISGLIFFVSSGALPSWVAGSGSVPSAVRDSTVAAVRREYTPRRGLFPSGCALRKNGGPQCHGSLDLQPAVIGAVHIRQDSRTRCPQRVERAAFLSFDSPEIRSNLELEVSGSFGVAPGSPAKHGARLGPPVAGRALEAWRLRGRDRARAR